jgi:hypothetical protein
MAVASVEFRLWCANEGAGQDEVCAPCTQQDGLIQGHRPHGKVVGPHPACHEGDEGQLEQQRQISPQNTTIDVPHRLEQMMVVVPVDAEGHKAQHDRDQRTQRVYVSACSTFIFSTIIVMRIAQTPLLNVSNRPLPISLCIPLSCRKRSCCELSRRGEASRPCP